MKGVSGWLFFLVMAVVAAAGCGRSGVRTFSFAGYAAVAYDVTQPLTDDAGYFVSLDYDNTGIPHLAFFNFTGLNLMYATLPPGTGPQGPWSTSIVDAHGNVGAYPCIVVDDQGNPHIIYSAVSPGYEIRHAYYIKETGQWIIRKVVNRAAGFISCAYGINGWIHVSYIQLDDYNLRYLVIREDYFSYEDKLLDYGATQAGSTGQLYNSDLAVDLSNRPHIVYYDAINGNTKYIAKNSQGRFYDEVIEWQRIEEEVEFKQVNEPDVLVAYLSKPSSGRKEDTYLYAWLPGSSFPSEVTSEYWNFYQYDRARISILKDKYDLYPSGTTFSISYLDSTSSPDDDGYFCAIAVDPEGIPHVAYFDYTTWDLKYAYKKGGRWHTEVVDGAQGDAVGAGVDIALTSDRRPFIVYRDMWNKQVKAAVKLPEGGWKVGVIYEPDNPDDVEFTGMYPQIKRDPQGNFGIVLREWRKVDGINRGVVIYLYVQ